MTLKEVINKLEERNEKISKAKKIRMLITKQKGLIKKKKSFTEFDEPVLFLNRRDGKIDFYEKATAGKFIFTHSDGKPRYIELRPTDQRTFPYGDKRVRCYIAHEDRPFAEWDNPINDSESVMLGYEKTKATDLKYQAELERLKNKARLTWVWILLAIAGAVIGIAFAYNTWIAPALNSREQAQASIQAVAPVVGNIIPLLMIGTKNKKNKSPYHK